MKRFLPILENDDKNPTLDELEEAFSVEAVTKEFFEAYKDKYLQVKEFLEENDDFVNEAKVRNFTSEQFTKKMLSQIVFLYFIQKKGWLGVSAFLPSLSASKYKNIFFKNGKKQKDLLSHVYQETPDGRYRLNVEHLMGLSPEEETILAECLPSAQWGTGPQDFMRQIFEGCVNRNLNFFDDYLEPLFYTGLNEHRKNAFFQPLHRKIPFLNGGLFEELDGYDWRNNDFNIPNELFSNKSEKGNEADGILDIFDRYNFTMAEDEPLEKEVAVDPEMLGKVFENLLEVKDRKSKGAFYTPREIVHYMCQESLINYLSTKSGIPEEDIRKFILYGEYFKDEDCKRTIRVEGQKYNSIDKTKDMEIPETIFSYKKNVNRLRELDDLLANVKVVDPAVGSGAFPLGMLNEIVKARDTLSTYLSIEMSPYEKAVFYSYATNPDGTGARNTYDMKKETIKNCIYACDIEPSASDITKLRLWLSLVIEDEISSEEEASNADYSFGKHAEPKKLPNLECNILCGNSLVDGFEGVDLISESEILSNLGDEHQETMFQQGVDPMIATLISLQDSLFNCQNHSEKGEIKEKIQEIYDNIIVEQLKTNPKLVEKYYESLKDNSKPFVIWQLYFPKVFQENGGFDICVGNPPYVGERKHKEVFYEVQNNSSLSEHYLGRMDLFYFFFHLALNLLHQNGVCSLITTNYYTTALGARKLRKDLKKRADIIELINFNECKVFETALGQHNIITFLQKGHTNRTAKTLTVNVNGAIPSDKLQEILRNGWESAIFQVEQDNLYDGDECYIRINGINNNESPINAILNKIQNHSTDILGNICRPLIGLESSLDSVYVLTKEEIDEITGGREHELEHVKMFFKGSQIHRYYVEEESDRYILYLHEKIDDIQKCSGIWNYLKENEIAIKGRKGANLRGAYRRGNWWVLNTPRLDMDFTEEKIVTHYRTKSLRFALSDKPWYASRDVYYIVKQKPNISLKYILALLNSSLYYLWFYYRGKRKGDTLELYAKPLKETPIKEISEAEQLPFIQIVEEIIDKQKSGIDTKQLQQQIDMMVYQLYGLTDKEIELIEGNGEFKYGII